MVRLSDAKIKKCQGVAYYRGFGNQALSALLSRTQAMIIKNGHELEHMILERVNTIDDLDKYLREDSHEGIHVVPRKIIKESKTVNFDGIEPDFMVFVEKNRKKACHIVELKDGCEFDTKSSSAEKTSVSEFIRNNAQKLQYTFDGHICCFNEKTREGIVKGFKNKIDESDALTGKEFCKLLEIDYNEIIKKRKKYQKENVDYFLKTLTEDKILKRKLKLLIPNKEKK